MRYLLPIVLVTALLAGCNTAIESTSNADEVSTDSSTVAEYPSGYVSGRYDPAIHSVRPDVDPNADWEPNPWPESMPRSEPVLTELEKPIVDSQGMVRHTLTSRKSDLVRGGVPRPGDRVDVYCYQCWELTAHLVVSNLRVVDVRERTIEQPGRKRRVDVVDAVIQVTPEQRNFIEEYDHSGFVMADD